MLPGNVLEDAWCAAVKKVLADRQSPPVFLAEGLFMYFTLEQIRRLLDILKDNFPRGILIAEQNCKLMVRNEKHHDTVKNTNAHFRSGTDSAQEITDLTDGIRLLSEHSFNEEMKKYSLRGKLFALLLPKVNDRWATFAWGNEVTLSSAICPAVPPFSCRR